MDDLLAVMRDVDGAEDVDHLWNTLSDYLTSCGVDYLFYRHIPLIASDGFEPKNILVKKLPSLVVERYISEKFYESDILQMRAFKQSQTFEWLTDDTLKDATESQTMFVKLLMEYMGNDILILPVYGNSNRSGYFCLSFNSPKAGIAGQTLRSCQIICNHAHIRYAQYLTRKKHPAEPLSNRELEIIRWVARGKSNSVIGDIMGISRHTVDSYLRRIFIKLEATDRTTAALKALNIGLIIS